LYESKSLVKALADKYGRDSEALMPILQGIIAEQSYLSDTAMLDVAKELDLSAAHVFGTASFYSFLDHKERGKFVIRICKTISCDMKGKAQILRTIEDTLKIKHGETTSDKKFTLLETNCMGWCHKAPAMLINDIPYTELTTDKVIEIIQDYQQK
jgi:NADH-quinone oxidoreductase subunit E